MNDLKLYPQEREIIKAEDISNETAIIQGNFDELDNVTISLAGDNVFIGSNTFGNINVSGNTFSSVDTNGNITITPNGTGKTLTSKDFQAGNIKLSSNTISAENTNGDLILQSNGTGLYKLGSKVMFTPEGGLAIKLTNKTGTTSVKGSVVSCGSSVDNSFILQANEYDSIGIVYESGIADGSECWVIIAGIAEILLKDTTGSTRGHVVFAADTDGRAITGALPSPPTDTSHFKEIGHCLETKSSGTNVLFKAVIHFN